MLPSYPSRLAGATRWPERTCSRPRSLRQNSLERGRVGDRRLAREAFADVDGRLAVDEWLAGEQRDLVGRADRDDRVRLERLERGAGDRRLDRADDRDLAGRREVEVERGQGMAEGGRGSRNRAVDEPEHPHR